MMFKSGESEVSLQYVTYYWILVMCSKVSSLEHQLFITPQFLWVRSLGLT